MLDTIKPEIAVPSPTLVRTRLRGIALPNEHGAWGMLFEPLVAGAAVAFSVSALWISLAVIAAFLLRQPLKVLMLGLMSGRSTPHAAAAYKYLYLYATIFVIAGAGALAFSPPAVFLPLIIAAPLAAIPIYFDAIGKSRNLFPELAGSVAINSSAAMIALAGGWTLAGSVALWAILSLRWGSTICGAGLALALE